MSVYAGPEISQSGLVLHLDAANAKSYPGSGSTWYDLSGNRNNGSLSGTSFANNVINFNGTSNYANGNIQSTSTWTKSIWYKSNVINGAPVYYPFSTYPSTGLGFGGTYDGNTVEKWYFFDGAATFPVANIAINNWYNLVVTKTGTTYNLYTNGNLSVSNQTGANLTISSYTLGRRMDGVWYANGSIAIASLYNRVLSPAEVKQNFNVMRGRFGI